LDGTSLFNKCDIYNDKCKLRCSTLENENDCNNKNYCFWLYKSNLGNDGDCKSKIDSSIICSNAKRSEQCTISDVNNLGNNNCLWLLGNISNIEEPSKCENKVLFKNNQYILFYQYI
jgi:hypothetical protein